MLRPLAGGVAVLSAAALAACGSDSDDPTPAAATITATTMTTGSPAAAPTPKAPAAAARAAAKAPGSGRKTIATGLEVPWGVAFLPDGDALVSARKSGAILRIPAEGGTPKQVMTLPSADNGEGGLLGLAVSPDYAKDGLVYAYYSSDSDNRIARFKLGGEPQVIVKGLQNASIHNGGRLAFGPDGKLYAGVGDAGTTSNAQNTRSQNGKILRMNPDGSRPSDNPFGNLVWSYGHRNPQGLTFDKAGRLWAVEFGQNAFDEVNLIRKGGNYGWPNVEGSDSGGGKYILPKVTWRTSEASPSGVAYAKGALYVGALQGARVYRIKLSGTKAGTPTSLFTGKYGRVRTLQAAPNGKVWLTTSNRDGRGTPRSGDDRIVSFNP